MTRAGDSPETVILDDVVAAIEKLGMQPSGATSIATLVQWYFRYLDPHDITSRRADDLVGAVLTHRELGRRRPTGTAQVRVFNPTVDDDGWSSSHSILQIVTDDMPFLVDSVTSELTRQGLALHLVVHPVFSVCRTGDGRVSAVGLPHEDVVNGHRESWMHFEVDKQSDEDTLEELAKQVTAVLDDVRAAVSDWKAMRKKASDLAHELREQPPTGLNEEAAEAAELLEWLEDDHYTFIGYREYDLRVGDSGTDILVGQHDSSLGVMRLASAGRSEAFSRLPEAVRQRARDRRVLVLTKANRRSTVHRSAYLDYVGIKRFDTEGNVVGERRFIGLLSAAAYTTSVRRIPVVSQKVHQVVQRSKFPEGSHSERDLFALLETYPRDELFSVPVDDLERISAEVLHLQERRRTKIFVRQEEYGRYATALVYLPRDRYTTEVRQKMQELLLQAFDADVIDHEARVSESVLARLYFVIRRADGGGITMPDDIPGLESIIGRATQGWQEDLQVQLRDRFGEERGNELARQWDDIPEGYKDHFGARIATVDLDRFDILFTAASDDVVTPAQVAHGRPADGMITALYQPLGRHAMRMKIYRREPISLAKTLKILSNFGVDVTDQRPFVFTRSTGEQAYLYDFGLSRDDGFDNVDSDEFIAAFSAAWRAISESDGLDRLVLTAGLTWREIVVVRAYSAYLRQTGLGFSSQYVENTLVGNQHFVAMLLDLFTTCFDPSFDIDLATRRERCAEVRARLDTALDTVTSLDTDRILRAFVEVIEATLRTNYFVTDDKGHPAQHLSLKFDPSKISHLPKPVPTFELWVYSPQVEGVHLRFAKVARGGLRWSDRPEDFRTEVLGLVKAQMVKNAVIVPSGAKGCFYPKQLPDQVEDRQAWVDAGREAYRTFIRGMLDVTDNLALDADRATLPPAQVVKWDDDDPYLVVAADKGTATFSDVANTISAEYDFWLGDAFASGGSVGYDHKVMGITARGAWESVKRHFHERGLDTQTTPFTVVGIGDMSGDVFGNGMLLSDQIKLVAAFDHRHIFLDPEPDPEASYAERERLFEMPRSSWADYDTSVISAGGGVFDRSVKSIPVGPKVRDVLGVDHSVTSLTPPDMIKAILAAPVDLLWNGGIGTYVKSSEESHHDVGDRTNDAVRLNGNELRVRVVGEGGNLGLTQRGRIEAAAHGVSLNTDAIDNSAGVDCSDHEVNIKILLDQVVGDGDLTGKQRNELLDDMTDDVADLVLRDNIEQNILLGNARAQNGRMLAVHSRYIKTLEENGLLDRALEFLPSDEQIEQLSAQGKGLTSPELSVLLAYAKLNITDALADTDLPADPGLKSVLPDYFPQVLEDRFAGRMNDHPLASQIVMTCLVNEVVNRGGITFVFRAQEETNAPTDHVLRSFWIARNIYDMAGFLQRVDAMSTNPSSPVPIGVTTSLYLEFRRLIDRATRWFLHNRPDDLDITVEIDRFSSFVERQRLRLGEVLRGHKKRRWVQTVDELVAQGVDEDIAQWCAGLLASYAFLDLQGLSQHNDHDEDDVVAVYFELSDRYGVDDLLDRIANLPRSNRWQSLARASQRDDLYAALELLTHSVLEHTKPSEVSDVEPRERVETLIDRWETMNANQLARARGTLEEVRQMPDSDLAAVSVALRQLRGVVRSSAVSAEER